MKTLLSLLVVLLLLNGCSSTIRSADNASAIIKKHSSIAILPFEVRIDLRNSNRKQFSEKELADVRHFMALGLQQHVYNWLISYSSRKPLTVSIQNIDITDSILTEQKISYIQLYQMGRTELAKMFNVDAVLTSNVIFTQPNSEAVAAVLTAIPGQNLFFSQLATQEMKMQVSLTDNLSEDVIWIFETKTQNSSYTSKSKDHKKENILYPLFENIDKTLIKFIKKFPYRKN